MAIQLGPRGRIQKPDQQPAKNTGLQTQGTKPCQQLGWTWKETPSIRASPDSAKTLVKALWGSKLRTWDAVSRLLPYRKHGIVNEYHLNHELFKDFLYYSRRHIDPAKCCKLGTSHTFLPILASFLPFWLPSLTFCHWSVVVWSICLWICVFSHISNIGRHCAEV